MSSDDRADPATAPSADPVGALRRLARSEIVVDDERMRSIEARIGTSISAAEDDRVVSLVPRRPRLPLAGALAAACLIALFVVVVGVVATGDRSVVIAAADGVVITLADGSQADGVAGSEVPDGSLLDVTGFVEVGGERFGPGRYEVRDGRLRPVSDDDPVEGDRPVPTEPTPPAVSEPASDRPASTDPARPPDSATTVPVRTVPVRTVPVRTEPVGTEPVATVPSRDVPATTVAVPSRTVPPGTVPPRTVPPRTVPPRTVPPTSAARDVAPATTVPPTTVPSPTVRGATRDSTVVSTTSPRGRDS